MDKKSLEILKGIGNLALGGITAAGALTLAGVVDEAKRQAEEKLKQSAAEAAQLSPPPKAPTVGQTSTPSAGQMPAFGSYAFAPYMAFSSLDPYMVLSSFAPMFRLSYALNLLPYMPQAPKLQITPGFSFGKSLGKLKK